jgi:hypothetical protein
VLKVGEVRRDGGILMRAGPLQSTDRSMRVMAPGHYRSTCPGMCEESQEQLLSQVDMSCHIRCGVTTFGSMLEEWTM